MSTERFDSAYASRAIDVTKLRAAVQHKVDSTSLRSVAAEMGMSPSGLRSFLIGGDPYSQTRQRLLAWYVKEAANHTYEVVDTDAAHAALEILVSHLPVAAREAVTATLRAELAAQTKSLRVPLPKWLRVNTRNG